MKQLRRCVLRLEYPINPSHDLQMHGTSATGKQGYSGLFTMPESDDELVGSQLRRVVCLL